MASWSIYLIRDDCNSLYTGITVDVRRRFREHCGGLKGAKYTRGRKGLTLAYSCELGTRVLASRVEYRLKKLPKKEKERIVAACPGATELCSILGLQVSQSAGRR